ncbi:DUF4142 domain-containing protein [Janthinobacterium agaricidamnosum]|uniref:Uncharacterized domain protein n=1 Tax=Janthinobacterium agaricidamnosum NBRC 102515 = DSM 9628 TaxID=1349767 RepID=W0VBZ5_9BURK|nr:DUF4142 domain-containing protein [Janthinobacterium agaricidamnosum]CDG85411.1 putative uncharacterized domain protein [Janthinobacterium agaricidamnosum NBRC 102515 = DSM 9628]
MHKMLAARRIWRRFFGISLMTMLCGALVAQAQGTATLSRADQKLVVELAQANMAEIDAGKLAASKAQNPQLKAFGQQMVDDHTRALQEVQQLAQAKGVALPAETDSKHKQMAQKLAGLSGDAFDRQYAAHSGVDDHQKAHALLQRVQARAKDPDLKALAARLMPAVDQHLTSVQQLNAAIKGNTASGTSGTAGNTGGSAHPATPAANPDTSAPGAPGMAPVPRGNQPGTQPGVYPGVQPNLPPAAPVKPGT